MERLQIEYAEDHGWYIALYRANGRLIVKIVSVHDIEQVIAEMPATRAMFEIEQGVSEIKFPTGQVAHLANYRAKRFLPHFPETMASKLKPWLDQLAANESLSRRSGMVFLFAEGKPGQSRPTRYVSGIRHSSTVYFSHGCGEGLVASEEVTWEPESLAEVVATLQRLGFAVPDMTNNPNDYAF